MESQQSKKAPAKKPARRKRVKKEDKPYYIDPKVFLEGLYRYVDGDECKKLERYLFTSIKKIAIGLSHSPSFINYSFKDEMISDATAKMSAALLNKKFKINKGSPFGYFTTISYHAFINRIKKEKKYHATLKSYREMVYDDALATGKINTSFSEDDS